jgi:L-fucose isomerase-like protein
VAAVCFATSEKFVMSLEKQENGDRSRPTLAFVALARPTFDLPLAREVTAAVKAQLRAADFNLIGPDALIMDHAAAEAAVDTFATRTHDLLLIFQATFADSTMLTTLANATQAPLLLWAPPEAPTGGRLRLNALCGINLGGHALNLRGRRYAYAYAPPTDPQTLEQVRALAAAGRAQRKLRSAHIGLVGQHPAGMDTCRFDAHQLRERFGVRMTEYPLGELFGRMDRAPEGALQTVRGALGSLLHHSIPLEETALRGTLSAYVALDQLAAEARIDGFAVRCWPEIFEQKGCAACGALSLLNDAHVPSSCEADVNGTVTQLLLQAVSGTSTFDCDVVSVDRQQDQVVIWHCGKAPLSMSDPTVPAQGGLHSNRQVPLVMEFPLKPGRITAARLSQAGGRLRLVVGSGEMLAAPKSFSGTSGVVRFDQPADAVLDTILGEGLEHHLAITYGDHVPALLAFATLVDLPTLQLGVKS